MELIGNKTLAQRGIQAAGEYAKAVNTHSMNDVTGLDNRLNDYLLKADCNNTTNDWICKDLFINGKTRFKNKATGSFYLDEYGNFFAEQSCTEQNSWNVYNKTGNSVFTINAITGVAQFNNSLTVNSVNGLRISGSTANTTAHLQIHNPVGHQWAIKSGWANTNEDALTIIDQSATVDSNPVLALCWDNISLLRDTTVSGKLFSPVGLGMTAGGTGGNGLLRVASYENYGWNFTIQSNHGNLGQWSVRSDDRSTIYFQIKNGGNAQLNGNLKVSGNIISDGEVSATA